MGVFDILIATAIFTFFFFYTIYFISSVQLELRAPTKLAADQLFDNLKTKILRIPIEISSNYTKIMNEALKIRINWPIFDRNSTVLKIEDVDLVPSQFLEDYLVFPVNSTNGNVTLYIYFTNGTKREMHNYSTDLRASSYPNYFDINNSFYNSSLFVNCSFSKLEKNNINIFKEGIEVNDNVLKFIEGNVSTRIKCQNLSYDFFSYSPKIMIESRQPINISLKPIFSRWETEESSGSVGKIGLPGYSYRRNITINNTANNNVLREYQVAINLTYDSDMQSDFRDIRFTYYNTTTGTETEIPYWVEKKVDSSWVYVWVKVPYIPANGYATIYVYYGNPSATSASNSTAVFGKNASFYYNRDNYYVALILSNREWVSGGTNLGITGDDAGASRTLSFSVLVYQTTISAVYLSTNGLLRWDNVADTRYSNSLDTSNKILTAHWDDLYVYTSYRSDAGIYEITGSDSIGDYVAYRWATTYFSSTSTPADFEILLYKNGYIQFNVYRTWSSATPNEYISRGDSVNYIDLTPRWKNMESVLFAPRAYPEPTYLIGEEEVVTTKQSINETKKLLLYNESSYLLFLEFERATNITLTSESNELNVTLKEPINFSIYLVNYSEEIKEYYKNREISFLLGSAEQFYGIINESIQEILNKSYDEMRSILGYNFFINLIVEDEDINYLKGEYATELRRLEERRILYYDEDFNKSIAVVKIGIW